MPEYTRSTEAWERVITAIEADAAKAASLLAQDDLDARPGIEYDDLPGARRPQDDIPTDVPATWRLPGSAESAEDPATTLPDTTEMPPIPAELRDRIKDLRTRITTLQSDLSAAMAEARTMMRRTESTVPERPPALIDREL